MFRLTISVVALAASAAVSHAQSVKTYPYVGSFDDATFGVQTAIENKGLVIDYVSHVGDMLNRTGADVGSDVKIFDHADVFLFCSAVTSRKMMEADPMNIAYCPYGVFVTESEGQVLVGYRLMPEGPMKEVEALLDSIAQDAVDN